MPPSLQPSATSDSGHVLRRVSQSLRSLIRASVPELAAEDAVVFDSPADIDSQVENRLSLFLHTVNIDVQQRNQPEALTRQPGTGGGPASLRSVLPPVVVTATYMMVPYAKSRELEMVIADRLLRLFHVVRALAGPLLDPALVAAGNTEIPIRPVTLGIEAQRGLWAGFPGKDYKLTLLYTLSQVKIPADSGQSVTMILDSLLKQQEVDH